MAERCHSSHQILQENKLFLSHNVKLFKQEKAGRNYNTMEVFHIALGFKGFF